MPKVSQQNVEAKLQKLKQQAEALRNRERLNLKKRMESIGKIAYQANIVDFDDALLLGAFIEIAERANDESVKNRWLASTNAYSEKPDTRISIKFATPPSMEIRQLLKQRKFRWNAFRGEYYGKSDKDIMAGLLKDIAHTIEVL